MLLLPGNARRSPVGQGDGACSVQLLCSAGYEPDEFREMMTEMSRNLATP